jgi:hypothetical protein
VGGEDEAGLGERTRCVVGKYMLCVEDMKICQREFKNARESLILG